jgi:hypothetical protein
VPDKVGHFHEKTNPIEVGASFHGVQTSEYFPPTQKKKKRKKERKKDLCLFSNGILHDLNRLMLLLNGHDRSNSIEVLCVVGSSNNFAVTNLQKG